MKVTVTMMMVMVMTTMLVATRKMTVVLTGLLFRILGEGPITHHHCPEDPTFQGTLCAWVSPQPRSKGPWLPVVFPPPPHPTQSLVSVLPGEAGLGAGAPGGEESLPSPQRR